MLNSDVTSKVQINVMQLHNQLRRRQVAQGCTLKSEQPRWPRLALYLGRYDLRARPGGVAKNVAV